jgi:Chalcone isomerase-like
MHAALDRRHFIALGLALLGGAARAADAVQVEGQPFARKVSIAGQELQLNGTGVRAVAWFKGYAAGLYLPTRGNQPAQVVAMAGPKRLQLRMLQEAPASELVKALNKGVERNTAPADLPTLAARRAQLDAAMLGIGSVKKGDVVDLDYEPGRGLLFSLNGTLRGEAIAGADLYAALLRSFVGERPYDKALKAGLLGLPTR